MTDAELLTLAGREIERLTEENDHCAAVIMKALVERVRAGFVVSLDRSGVFDPRPAVGAQ